MTSFLVEHQLKYQTSFRCLVNDIAATQNYCNVIYGNAPYIFT
ncbi:12345_t:CDS:1, partial [Gigaspora rosea]